MSATILTAISTLFEIVFSKNQPTLFIKVVIFGLAGKRCFVFTVFGHLYGLE